MYIYLVILILHCYDTKFILEVLRASEEKLWYLKRALP